VTKRVDKEIVKPGETLSYTIRIINVGNKQLKARTMTLYDKLDDHVTYVGQSSFSGLTGTLLHLPDDPKAVSGFPLDESGHLMTTTIERRGGSYDMEFKVVVDGYEKITNQKVENAGRLVTSSGIVYPYSALSMIDFGAKIDIINTVYRGHNKGASCGTGQDVEKVQGDIGDAVTYCLLVTNVGLSKLGNVQVVDEVLQYINTNIGLMIPGAKIMFSIEKTITGTITNIATATGNPLFFDGSDIPDHPDVSDSDPSAIDKIDHSPNIQVENKGKFPVSSEACNYSHCFYQCTRARTREPSVTLMSLKNRRTELWEAMSFIASVSQISVIPTWAALCLQTTLCRLKIRRLAGLNPAARQPCLISRPYQLTL
jgi:uncharacterized repeat protein (TIGR01451 family)